MGSILIIVLGTGVGVAIVFSFFGLLSFAEDVQRHAERPYPSLDNDLRRL
jgi:hypothetical protein